MKLLALAFVPLISLTAQAKRAAPPGVEPVRRGHIEYRPLRQVQDCPNSSQELCTMTLDLQARQGERELWRTPLYRVDFKRGVETDIQEVLPTELSLKGRTIRLKDESGTSYEVDASRGERRKPKPLKVYKGKE